MDWWPGGAAASAEARRLDRPILLSVGYSAWHWCQKDRRPVRRSDTWGQHPGPSAGGAGVRNAIMERWIGGCRRELIDHTLIWNQCHLLQVLREYEAHHNAHRPHRSLKQAAPLKPLPPPVADIDALRVHRHDRVGGVIHESARRGQDLPRRRVVRPFGVARGGWARVLRRVPRRDRSADPAQRRSPGRGRGDRRGAPQAARVKLVIDEMYPPVVAEQLRRAGHDADRHVEPLVLPTREVLRRPRGECPRVVLRGTCRGRPPSRGCSLASRDGWVFASGRPVGDPGKVVVEAGPRSRHIVSQARTDSRVFDPAAAMATSWRETRVSNSYVYQEFTRYPVTGHSDRHDRFERL